MSIIVVERVNIAVNAVIAEQAAAARLLMASQALAACREQNNPYLPRNFPLGPPRSLMYGPDPCSAEEEALAGATAAHQEAQQAAQIANAPAAAAVQVAPAVQMSDTWDSSELFDPTTMNVEIPHQLDSMWSPTSIEDVMEMIALQMEVDEGLNVSSDEEMEIIYTNMIALIHWSPAYKTHKRKGAQVHLKNNEWIGTWLPK